MATEITSDIIGEFRQALAQHPIYEAVRSLDDLRCFMTHHVYSVWDFMSLIKYLQSSIAPAIVPWAPRGDGSVRRFINELVLEEESDETHRPGEYTSHFELYQRAMNEIGADVRPVHRFVDVAQAQGVEKALALPEVPPASRDFTAQTFEFIRSDRLHRVAAALALGREHIIPGMFRSILGRIGIDEGQAPIFHFYLKRHVHLDEDFHAPLSLRLLDSLCGQDSERIDEAIEAARESVAARLRLWDGVLEALQGDGCRTARGIRRTSG